MEISSKPVANSDTVAKLVVDSDELLRGRKAVAIAHHGIMYKLQATKLGKLILTK